MFANCGFQKTSDLVAYLNNFLGLGLERIPCAGSIENWVKKAGYDTYRQAPADFSDKNYATITDESMMLGSEKMLLTLGVEAEKSAVESLPHSEIKVLDISVSKNWDSQTVTEKLEELEKKVGHRPLYSISDNDSKLCKSFRERDYIHIRDIGHTVARLIEQVYGKDEAFKQYSKRLSAVKVREVMRASSYLLPPRQRTIARFMNLSPTIKWSVRINNNFSKLSDEEAKNFLFVKEHFPLIEELEQIFNSVDELLKEAKNEGFSKKNIDGYIAKIQDNLTHQSTRVQRVKLALCHYLAQEKEKLLTAENIWHCSSDIIESLFGVYKYKRSSNLLNGITPYVLVIPLKAAAGNNAKPTKLDFKAKLENVFMKDLTQWKENNLTENLAVKRQKKLVA